jgi:hypothetical protein
MTNHSFIYIYLLFYCLDGPGSSIAFNPADESITKTQGQSLGPIICSAQCNPPCQLYWIKPDGSVVDGSNLEIPSLSKNDHGTVICHAGNGYGNNATKNLLVTVNCKYICLEKQFKVDIFLILTCISISYRYDYYEK